MLPLCLVVLGEPPPAIAADLGRYPAWFEAITEGAALEAVDGVAGPEVDPRDWAGVVLTGSPASLTAPEPWMERGAALIRRCAEVGTPVLGVCFGHQLAAAAFGGRVEQSAAGWELGTLEVSLTEAGATDPLFSDAPRRFEVNLSHTDDVVRGVGSASMIELATNDRGIQALAIGEAVRGVQFHPEFDGAITRAFAGEREREGEREAAATARAARDTPIGSLLMKNFVRHFAARA